MNKQDSLETRFPAIAKEWDWDNNEGITPSQVSSGSHKKVFWICPICKKSYSKAICNRTSPSKRTAESKKCPICLGRIIIPGYNSLKATNPKVVELEWDYSKNDIDPDTIPPHQNKKYWWKCNNGHQSYESTVNNKISGTGGNCPYCSSQKLSEEKSLAFLNSSLAKEWHPVKNGEITPSDIFANSNEKVWWLCPVCNHEWEATVTNRNNNKRGCPSCAKGRQSSLPEQFIYYYIKQIFLDAINNYKLNSSTEIDVYIPSIKLGIEYDGEFYHSSNSKYIKDKAKNNLLYEKGVQLIRIREENCYPMNEDYCTIYKVKYTSDYSDLQIVMQKLLDNLCLKYNKSYLTVNIDAELRNLLAMQLSHVAFKDSFAYYIKSNPVKALWDSDANYPLTSEMVTPMSDKVVTWICKNNSEHRWKAPIKSISKGYGCARCAGRHNYNSEEWIQKATKVHGTKYDYSKVQYVNSKGKVTIICNKHGEFSQSPSEHLSGKGCAYCTHQSFHDKETLAFVNPSKANEWDYDKNYPTTPADVLISDSKEYYWKCDKGEPHSYKASVKYRLGRNSGCAVCHGKQVDYLTSVEALRPDLAEEWCIENKYKPSEVSLGSEKRILWKCKNADHDPYSASVYNRAHLNSGCPECSGNIKSSKTYEKEVAEKFPNIKLLSNYEKSNVKVNCQCQICGYEWTPFPYNLLKGKGCPECNKKKLK